MSNEPRLRVTTELGVPIAMSDGTVLRADISRPDIASPVPVLLLRNPYPAMAARSQLDALRAAEAGFAVVAQSVRGTGPSDGSFEPWLTEEIDGVDTIAWCASQPWSSGRVGTIGGSYLGHTQIYAAGGAPPALAAMAVDVVPSAPYDLTYNGGAMLLGSSLGWALGQAMTKTLRALQRGENVGATMQELFALMTLSHTELCRTDRLAIPVLERVFPAWRQWLDHPTNDDWWDSVDLNDRPAIPTLQTTGWWDLFLGGSLQEFAREPRHAKSRLVIGPWSHMVKGAAHGSVFYGMGASFMNTDVTGQQLDFLGRYLFDGRPEPEGPPVRIFVMGANTWRDEDAWPLARATNVQFFLHDGGRLSTDAPVTDAAPASFEFDPLDPVPTVGGRNLLPGSEGTHMTGPCDHSVLDIRHDILRFVSDPLDADMEVTGHVSVTLHAATSAADTDWSAMLLDVWPDGRAFNVADGYLRARHRNGNDRAAPINAGEPTRYEIDLVATSQVFKSGHRLRVDISSSNFPRYDRNPGTGALSSEVSESEFVSAHQTVFVDATRASFITLPIVP